MLHMCVCVSKEGNPPETTVLDVWRASVKLHSATLWWEQSKTSAYCLFFSLSFYFKTAAALTPKVNVHIGSTRDSNVFILYNQSSASKCSI